MRERPSPYATYIHIDVYFTMYRRHIVPRPLGLHCFTFCMSSPAYIISAVAVTSVEEHSWFAVSILRGVNRGAHFFSAARDDMCHVPGAMGGLGW